MTMVTPDSLDTKIFAVHPGLGVLNTSVNVLMMVPAIAARTRNILQLSDH